MVPFVFPKTQLCKGFEDNENNQSFLIKADAK